METLAAKVRKPDEPGNGKEPPLNANEQNVNDI
jgi:hypothetical protein